MSYEVKAQLLKYINPQPRGVRELAKKLHRRPKNVISLVKEMETEGLIEIKKENRKVRGRPKKLITSTLLGEDFLNTYKELELKPLRSNKNDLIKATKDAFYVNRLVARGKSPHKLFLELNSIVGRNSRNSI